MLYRYTSLKQKKYRDQLKLYSVSGFKAVETAIKSKNIQIEALLIRSDQSKQISQVVDKGRFPIYKLTLSQFNRLSDEQNPQGIALINHKPDTFLDEAQFKSDIFIYLDQINDPGNLGTIIRTAAWFGIYPIMLSSNSADPYQPKTCRASAGIISHIKIYEHVEVKNLNTLKQKYGFKLIGASAYSNQSLNKFKFKQSQKYGLVFGSETHGISNQITKILNEQVNITSSGIGESLNIAVSTAIFLFNYQRQINLKTDKNE